MSLRKLVTTLSMIGPAVLVSVELFDPASIVTATASGATFGFEILWAAFYSGILLLIIQEISARLGVVTGKTLAENIHQMYGKRYSFLLFMISIFLDFSTLTAEIMGLTLVTSFSFKIPYSLGVVASILVCVFLVYFTSYGILEKAVMLLVTVIFLTYLYFVFALNIPLENVVYNSLVPSFNTNSFYYAEAIIGAAIMPTYIILHSGLVYEKGWAHHHEKSVEELIGHEDKHITSEKIDSVFSISLGTILNIVVIASAAVLIKGAQVNEFVDIAHPFYFKLGSLGLTLFAVAFACAGISAIITVGLGSVYNTFGFLGFEERIKKRRFKIAFIIWLLIAGIASLLPNQIQIMVFTQYLNGALLPLVIIPLLLLARNERIMGKNKLGKATTLSGVVAVIITTSLFLLSIISLIGIK